jgi:DNA polymerase-1
VKKEVLSDPKMETGLRVSAETFKAYLNGIAIRDGRDCVLSFDTETNAKDIRTAEGYMTSFSLCLSLTGKEHYVCYFPVAQGDKPELNEDWEWFKEFLANFPGILVMHNAKFDLEVLYRHGVDYKGRWYCTMLMAHLLNENYPYSKDLTSCVQHYVDKDLKKKDDQYFDFLKEFYGWEFIPVEVMRAYAEQDAYVTYRLFQALYPLFQKEVPDEYWEHKKKFMYVVRAMERQGVLIDQAMSREMIKIGEEEMAITQEKLGNFNPSSPNDLRRLFLDKLGLPVVKLTDSGEKLKREGKEFDPYDYASFDKEAMEEYEQILEKTDDTTAQLVLHFRGWQKTVSSNYRSYLEKIGVDGRLRPNYKLHGTKTGRSSCSDPNLQQIPRSSTKPWNGNLKQAFLPSPGYSLWEFDYSQLELRLATAYARIPELSKVFNEGRDIFSEMAVGVGLPRQETKTFVYATQYGAGIDRLMASLKVSRERAEEIRASYRNTYPGFVRVSSRASRLCKTSGKIELWSGRFRHFRSRKDDAHKAFNSVCQGGAADIVESIMVRLFSDVSSEDCRMVLTIHDSVVFEIKTTEVDDYTARIRAIMEDVRPNFGVKFAVEAKEFGK